MHIACIGIDLGKPTFHLVALGNQAIAHNVRFSLEFLSQHEGPIHVEYRDMRIISSGDLGFIHALDRFTGNLKSGEQSDLWPLFIRYDHAHDPFGL